MFKIEAPIWILFLKGSQISALQLKGCFKNLKRQCKTIEIKYKIHIKLLHEVYGTCFKYNVKN